MLIILSLILAIFAIVLILAARKSDTFRIERKITINARPEKVFPLIDDFHHWPSWSPWEKVDPAMSRSYSGATSGKGAAYAWDGNKRVGKGAMEIKESIPSTKIVIKLDFFVPFEAHNTAEFDLTESGDGTTVTWSMHGTLSYNMKVVHVFMSMDSIVGKDFESGLNNMKALAERS